MVLFIGSQIASTLVMSVTADKTQQRIMLLLPLFFAALIPNFPAGLIVYWITTNFWTLGQQLVVKRLSPPPLSPPRHRRARQTARPRRGHGAAAGSAGAGHEGLHRRRGRRSDGGDERPVGRGEPCRWRRRGPASAPRSGRR